MRLSPRPCVALARCRGEGQAGGPVRPVGKPQMPLARETAVAACAGNRGRGLRGKPRSGLARKTADAACEENRSRGLNRSRARVYDGRAPSVGPCGLIAAMGRYDVRAWRNGRRDRLKLCFCKECRFESDRPHHPWRRRTGAGCHLIFCKSSALTRLIRADAPGDDALTCTKQAICPDFGDSGNGPAAIAAKRCKIGEHSPGSPLGS
jgi:hypothetical protein